MPVHNQNVDIQIVELHWTVHRRLIMPPTEIIRFALIPIDKVPFHDPVTKPASNPKGSKWDGVLRALEWEGEKKAVKIVEPNKEKRNKYKAELQTMAKNRGLPVRVLEDGTAIYALKSTRAGRSSSPTVSRI